MENFEQRWIDVEFLLRERFGKTPDMEGILYLIGINELGRWPTEKKYTKEQKQDLMHVAVCSLLTRRGYFEMTGLDDEGWPHFSKTKDVEAEEFFSQERLLKECVIEYFEQ
ncbi:MAG: hypothetical protein R2800_12880 [Flavipsychrobacter sp.]